MFSKMVNFGPNDTKFSTVRVLGGIHRDNITNYVVIGAITLMFFKRHSVCGAQHTKWYPSVKINK